MRNDGKAVFAVVVFAVGAAWAPALWAITVPGAFFLALALLWITRGGRVSLSCPIAVSLLMATIGLVQLLGGTTEYRFQTNAAIIGWLTCAAVAWIARQCDARRMIAPLAYLAGTVAVLAILVHFTSTFHVFWIFPVRYPQVFGPYVYRNHYAAFAELTLPPAIYLACARRQQRPLFVLITAVILAGVVVAQSRAGTLLALAEIIAVLAIAGARRLLSLKVAAAVAISLFAAAFIVGFSGLTERFQEENPYHVRAEIVQSSLDMWRARPVSGWGLGTWRTVYPSYARIDPGVIVNEAHNDWLQWGCDGGLLAVLAMLALAGWCTLRGFQSVWGFGVGVVFVHALVDYPFQEPSIMFIAMLLAGLMTDLPPAQSWYSICNSHAAGSDRH
ncbi:MAG: O-antigen polymerase [Bryobacterales bacterium]|nr:O-antigen polymerase [Bryobacterales bacterium]